MTFVSGVVMNSGVEAYFLTFSSVVALVKALVLRETLHIGASDPDAFRST